MTQITPVPPETFARTNSRGLVEIVDIKTGRILCVQHSHHDLLQGKFERLTKIETPEGPVWIEKGINFDIVNHLKNVPYSRLLGNLICQGITEGKTKIQAIKDLNLEWADVKRWSQESEEFKESLRQAEKDRADFIGEQALEYARLSGDSSKMLDIAAIGDSDKFGKKTKISGDANAPIQFIIGTGIKRRGEEGYIGPAEPEKIEKSKDVTPKNDGIAEYAGTPSTD